MADSSNTGRNFLLIGIMLGVGAAAVGVYVLNSAAPDKLSVSIKDDGSEGSSLTQEAVQLKEDALVPRRLLDVAPPLDEASIPRDKVEGKKVPRYTPLFFAPTVWQVPDATQKKNVAVDLLAPDARPLHHVASVESGTDEKPVPNGWFYMYGLEKSLCMADAMQQDPDGDGFSNAEEFVAGTDPSNAESMPPFVVGDAIKLVSTGEKKVITHLIELSMASYFDENKVNISIFSENGQRLLQHRDLDPGKSFGFGQTSAGPMAKNRFTLEKIDQKSDETGNTVNSVRIKDAYTQLSDAKEFDLAAGSRNRRTVRDITLKLRVTAGPQKDTEIAVQPGQEFDVPGFKDTKCVVTDAGKKKTPPKVSVNGGAAISVPLDPATPQAKTDNRPTPQ